jgi:glycosyltransferase involved in cell wall biosynthesis
LPQALAARGHQVQGLLLSYRRRPEGTMQPAGPSGVCWRSINAGFPLPVGLVRHGRALREMLRAPAPDVVWAGSDVFHAIRAARQCRAARIPFVIDLYDNYEAFAAAAMPGVKAMFKSACRAAAGLTVVSHSLEEFVRQRYGVTAPRLVLGNAVSKSVFRPIPRSAARAALGLPEHTRLVGTAGAISADRGIDVLFEAFAGLADEFPDLRLVFAGPRDRTPDRHRHAHHIDLGILEPGRVPYLLSALDVAVICNADSDFGRYCFPQKFHEMVACGTPLVAAGVGEMLRLLASRPDCLFRPGSAESLRDCLRRQLGAPRPITHLAAPDWRDHAPVLEEFLARAAAGAR